MNEVILSGVYRRAAVSFVIAAAIFLFIVALTVLPVARIYVTPVEYPLSKQFTFMLTRSIADDQSLHALLGSTLQVEVTSEKTYPSTGHAEVSDDVSGAITIRNEYSKDQPLVATTRFLTEDGTLLRLRESVVVPRGGSVIADVYLDPNETGVASIQQGRLTIPGLWEGIQDRIYGEVTTSLTGPTRTVTAVSGSDISAARDELRTLAEESAILSLTEHFLASQEFPADILGRMELAHIRIAKEEWIESDSSGSHTNTFSVQGNFIFEGVFIIQSEARQKVARLLEDSLAPREYISFNEGAVEILLEDTDTAPAVRIEWNGRTKQNGVEESILSNTLVGRDKFGAEALLSAQTNIEKVRVELSPFWVQRVPKNITVTVENNEHSQKR